MLETGWCTKYCTAVQHTTRLIQVATLKTLMMLVWVLTPLQGDEITPSQTLGKPDNLHVCDHTMICKMKTRKYFTHVLFSRPVFLLVILRYITLTSS
jgi:hypothetical protein